MTSVVDAPRAVSSDASPTRPLCAVTRASMPAARAAAVNRIRGCGVGGGGAKGADRLRGAVLQIAHVGGVPLLIRFRGPHGEQHAVAVAGVRHVTPFKRAHFRPPQSAHEQQRGDHGVESAPAVRRGVGFDAPAVRVGARVAPRPRPTAESCGPPTSPSRATPSRVPSRCLRSSRPAAGGAPGCQARSAHHGRVEPVTQAFDEPIEVVPVEQRRQPRVERMARRGGQVRRRDPQRRLIRLARSHSHARQCSTTDRLCRSLITPTFTTGC